MDARRPKAGGRPSSVDGGARRRGWAASGRTGVLGRALKPPSFRTLKYLSFTHSGIYTCLLIVWLVPGLHREEMIFGWLHGVGWIVMSLLCIDAVRRRTIPLWLGVMVAVVGGVGPFAGTIGFLYAERSAKPPSRQRRRGMV